MSHLDDPDSDEEMTQDNSVPNKFENPRPNEGVYKLESFVTHLGAGLQAGHYVCHVREGDEWIYYNDDKVAKMDNNDPPIGKGYMYFLRKV